MDTICKETNLHPCVKQFKHKYDCRGALYAIQPTWLGPNNVSTMASEEKAVLQNSIYDVKKKIWNWKKYAPCHVKYHILLKNLKEYKFQEFPATKVHHLMNGIRCNKMSAVVAKISAEPDHYNKDFEAVVA